MPVAKSKKFRVEGEIGGFPNSIKSRNKESEFMFDLKLNKETSKKIQFKKLPIKHVSIGSDARSANLNLCEMWILYRMIL